jgi:hypothetical protein
LLKKIGYVREEIRFLDCGAVWLLQERTFWRKYRRHHQDEKNQRAKDKAVTTN